MTDSQTNNSIHSEFSLDDDTFDAHHNHIYSPIIHHHNNITKNHKIGGLPEKPYSSLTGRPSKKINCPQIILSYSNKKIQNANKKQHCAGATGHEQYHHFIYNDCNSLNTLQRHITRHVPRDLLFRCLYR